VLGAQPSFGSPASGAPAVVVRDLGKGTVFLNGPWQFHLGDNPAWALPSTNDTTGQDGWEQLTAAKPWGEQGHESYSGFGWYRLHLSVNPAPGVAEDFALLMPTVNDSYEIYWDGSLIGRFGKLPPHPQFYVLQPTHTFGLGRIRSGVLAMRVWKSPPLSDGSPLQGGFESAPLLGSPDAIARYKASLDYEWLRSNQFTFGLNSLYALAALLSLITWLRDRRQWLLFWMMGFCLSQPLMLFSLFMRLPIVRALALPLYQMAASVEDVCLWFLLLVLFKLDEIPALTRWLRRLAIAQLLLVNLDGLVCALQVTLTTRSIGLSQLVDYLLTIGYTLLETLPLALVVLAIVRRRSLDSGRWFVAAFAFLTEMIAVASSAAEQGRQYTHSTLADKLEAPLFTLRGNEITAQTLAGTLLLFSLLYVVYLYSEEERSRRAALEQEFRNARELQQVLIPEILPDVPGFALTAAYLPAQEVGGDFFQIIPVCGPVSGSGAGSSTLIVLGDVSGKGVKAAMAVSLIVGALRAFTESSSSPAEILAGLNRRLEGRLQGGFSTAIALRLDPDGRCLVACAGHPAPFLNGVEPEIPGALPLGLFATTTYQETALHLNAGDHLVLYTDGLLEARSPSGELYSFDRLQTLFAARPKAAEAAGAAVAFGQDDDITVLTLTRLAVGEETASFRGAPAHTPA
jgi:hypothetical protein